ncbi:MAG: lipase/acylhydrolase, partial [Paenibacillus sp.]|nr:lipase/acylhydrolase [Paenibacillus sp.]
MLHTIQSVKEGNQVLIVCMGDSITEQNSHCHQHLNYVGLFAEQLLQTFGRRTFVFNTGVSGEMTGRAIERLHLDALRHKPDLLTLMYGINDSKKGLEGVAEFRDNLHTLIGLVRQTDTELLLLSQNPILYDQTEPARLRIHYDRYLEVLREVAAELAVPF